MSVTLVTALSAALAACAALDAPDKTSGATFEGFLDAEPEELERNFGVNTTSLVYLAREFVPAMIDRGSGTIVVTGNTAALRGVPNYALFAPTKAAQRIFAQSLARDLGPNSIHDADHGRKQDFGDRIKAQERGLTNRPLQKQSFNPTGVTAF